MRRIDNNRYIKIVYYAYINRNSNWRTIVSGQLLQLKAYGLLAEADLYVHITDTTNRFDDVIDTIKSVHKLAVITTSNENHFEYHALTLLYNLAWQYPDCIFIYFHTKGMSYNIPNRSAEEVTLLTRTFDHWQDTIELFDDKRINKIGLFPAKEVNDVKLKQRIYGGWIWFNYWYARGSYLVNCRLPELTTDRYLYEEWLGGGSNKYLRHDGYSLFKNAENVYFSANEAAIEMARLVHLIY